MSNIKIVFSEGTGDDLHGRSSRMKRKGPRIDLSGKSRSIHFLRGVQSRAGFCLPAFYYFLGATNSGVQANSSQDYSFQIAQAFSTFTGLSLLSLSCRKVFDNDRKIPLTGANFGRISDDTLVSHAEYWARGDKARLEDAIKALLLLRTFFRDCSQSDSKLLDSPGILQKRIGLLKQYADRSAAHLSLEPYELDFDDMAHFTAAIVTCAEIVRSFDSPQVPASYFNDLDTASYRLAERTFPAIAKFQLFGGFSVEGNSRALWKFGVEYGVDYLINTIHNAIGHPPRETGGLAEAR